ncbi:YxlC family protein [Paenibacillus sp. HN-1]|uniref:YxlC family protein n=1 Tax=Paenibacillus TaxID=44249 RepID=UPI001CA7C137|nr:MULTISPECIES: YxlC family protein [Paenibacillus]MBY9077076.1 YxlC family protein [Paenibacillus sp. CGMCC 1.18879]MBY9086551.1 YxlC family protein [Paenibacillus sinensis]
MTDEKGKPNPKDHREPSDIPDKPVPRTDDPRVSSSDELPDDLLIELMAGLNRLDTVYAEESSSPPLDVLARKLEAAAEQSRLKRRRERRLFGVISLAVIALSLLAVIISPIVYWSLQGLVPVVALIVTIWRVGRRRRAEWK